MVNNPIRSRTTEEWIQQKFKDCLSVLSLKEVVGLMVEHYDSSDLMDIARELYSEGFK